MLKYEVRRLEDIVNNLDNKRKPLNDQERKEITQYGLYPYCGANGIVDYVDKYLFDEEILCIAEDGSDWSFNKKCSYIMNEKCWVNNHAHVVTAKKGIILKYLYYYLNYSDLSSKVTGTTRGKMTKSALNSIEIPIPDYDMQGRIVVILDKTQDLIDKRNQQIQACDEVIKSQFIEMFGDPVSNPKQWDKQMLGKLGELGRGVSKHRPRNDPKLLGGIYPLIQTGDVANADMYISEYKMTYSDLGLQQSKMWHKDTLCITIAANIAKTGILTFDACFPDSVVGFVANAKTNNLFMHYWFTFFQKILEEQAPESAQKNINLKILNELSVIVPPIELQNEFAQFVQKVDKLKFGMEQSLKQLEANFDALMQKAFKGELF